MTPSISVQTLARVPSAAAAEVAGDTAEDAADDADDIVGGVDPPHAVMVTANAAAAHDATTVFESAATAHSFLGCSAG
jgi:hypothetical protein